MSTRRLNLHESLKSAGRTRDSVRARTRSVLVVSEVAVSTTLLIASALLIQSLYRIHQERLGFSPRGLVTFETPLALDRRPEAQRLSFTRIWHGS